VEWSSFEVSGGTGDPNNVTVVPPFHYCAPSGATTIGIFSTTWDTLSGINVEQVAIWTVIPPDLSVHFLYQETNESSGGTSFVSPYPTPCSLPWGFDVESSADVEVLFVTTPTYNSTAAHSPFQV
jgi:hypothetical protein